MAAEPSTLRKGGNGREAEVLRRAVEIQLVSQETTNSHQRKRWNETQRQQDGFFLLAAAGVDPGRSALQSAEQRCQRRYGRIHRFGCTSIYHKNMQEAAARRSTTGLLRRYRKRVREAGPTTDEIRAGTWYPVNQENRTDHHEATLYIFFSSQKGDRQTRERLSHATSRHFLIACADRALSMVGQLISSCWRAGKCAKNWMSGNKQSKPNKANQTIDSRSETVKRWLWTTTSQDLLVPLHDDIVTLQVCIVRVSAPLYV